MTTQEYLSIVLICGIFSALPRPLRFVAMILAAVVLAIVLIG